MDRNRSVFDWRDNSPCIVKSGPVIRNPGTPQPTAIRVAQYDQYGNRIATFTSMKAASKTTGIDFRGICRNVKGERKSVGGFVFKEAKE